MSQDIKEIELNELNKNHRKLTKYLSFAQRKLDNATKKCDTSYWSGELRKAKKDVEDSWKKIQSYNESRKREAEEAKHVKAIKEIDNEMTDLSKKRSELRNVQKIAQYHLATATDAYLAAATDEDGIRDIRFFNEIVSKLDDEIKTSLKLSDKCSSIYSTTYEEGLPEIKRCERAFGQLKNYKELLKTAKTNLGKATAKNRGWWKLQFRNAMEGIQMCHVQIQRYYELKNGNKQKEGKPLADTIKQIAKASRKIVKKDLVQVNTTEDEVEAFVIELLSDPATLEEIKKQAAGYACLVAEGKIINACSMFADDPNQEYSYINYWRTVKARITPGSDISNLVKPGANFIPLSLLPERSSTEAVKSAVKEGLVLSWSAAVLAAAKNAANTDVFVK